VLRRWRRRRRSSDKPSGLPLDHYYGNCSTVSCTSWTWWNATSGTDGICTKVPSSSQVRNYSVELRFNQLHSCDELRFFVSAVRKYGNSTVKTGCCRNVTLKWFSLYGSAVSKIVSIVSVNWSLRNLCYLFVN